MHKEQVLLYLHPYSPLSTSLLLTEKSVLKYMDLGSRIPTSSFFTGSGVPRT